MLGVFRWLSHGQVLNRFVELLEIKWFLSEKGQEYPELTDINWLNDLHFFADFALHYNQVCREGGSGGVTARGPSRPYYVIISQFY